MNPEETMYFANPGIDGKFNKAFCFHWADTLNNPINDWRQIASTFLSIPMAHMLIGFYTVADQADGVLKDFAKLSVLCSKQNKLNSCKMGLEEY